VLDYEGRTKLNNIRTKKTTTRAIKHKKLKDKHKEKQKTKKRKKECIIFFGFGERRRQVEIMTGC